QVGHQDPTNRSGPYQGTAPHTGNFPGVGERGFRFGEAEVDQFAVSANAAFNVGERSQLYLTAIASDRDITSFAFYRSRNHNCQCNLLAQVYSECYVPEIN